MIKPTYIKCDKCKNAIAKNKIIKKKNRDIYINKNNSIAIKNRKESRIARCAICKALLGISLSTNNAIMLFNEKIIYEE